jgi:hypothetical protein
MTTTYPITIFVGFGALVLHFCADLDRYLLCAGPGYIYFSDGISLKRSSLFSGRRERPLLSVGTPPPQSSRQDGVTPKVARVCPDTAVFFPFFIRLDEPQQASVLMLCYCANLNIDGSPQIVRVLCSEQVAGRKYSTYVLSCCASFIWSAVRSLSQPLLFCTTTTPNGLWSVRLAGRLVVESKNSQAMVQAL